LSGGWRLICDLLNFSRRGVIKHEEFLLLFFFAVFFNALDVSASNKSCKSRPELFKSELKCQCGKNLTGIYRFDQTEESIIFSSSKFPLVAFCPYHEADHPWYSEGTYLFQGSAIVSGIIERSESDSLGETADFFVNTDKSKALPRPDRLLTSLRLSDDAFKKFHIPKLSTKHPCWAANAKIEIKQIEVNHDAGTDNAGNFLLDYTVLSVGKYRDCKR